VAEEVVVMQAEAEEGKQRITTVYYLQFSAKNWSRFNSSLSNLCLEENDKYFVDWEQLLWQWMNSNFDWIESKRGFGILALQSGGLSKIIERTIAVD
jgi:hypothetical protein